MSVLQKQKCPWLTRRTSNPLMPPTSVPVVGKKRTEQEKSVQERQGLCTEETFPWPKIVNYPVNEFKSEGYITCAFPTLLPTGAGHHDSMVLRLETTSSTCWGMETAALQNTHASVILPWTWRWGGVPSRLARSITISTPRMPVSLWTSCERWLAVKANVCQHGVAFCQQSAW